METAQHHKSKRELNMHLPICAPPRENWRNQYIIFIEDVARKCHKFIMTGDIASSVPPLNGGRAIQAPADPHAWPQEQVHRSKTTLKERWQMQYVTSEK